ncbi:iron export ABC transporter permease subunit FetB [Pleurocapsales cyanobacterium LEGE 06147]|nr:iron export ABC transporter permease subunit FetB [Pleurocapsales cyanobacterium LEGE 06147]
MTSVIELDFTDLVPVLGIIGVAIALSLWQKLNLEGQLVLGAGRALLQLLVVGYVLEIVFALDNVWSVLLILAIAVSIAAIVIRNRIAKKIRGLLPLVWLSLVASSALTLSYSILLIVHPPRWYEPQYLIPLAAMLLGNAINGASLAGERLVSAIEQNRQEIETHLCLGATPKQAIDTYRKEAIRISLIPTLNQMMVVGLVSLPAMFNGQVLAGTNPLNAASYQILILFAIVLTNLIANLLVTTGLYRRFFNQAAQLNY